MEQLGAQLAKVGGLRRKPEVSKIMAWKGSMETSGCHCWDGAVLLGKLVVALSKRVEGIVRKSGHHTYGKGSYLSALSFLHKGMRSSDSGERKELSPGRTLP